VADFVPHHAGQLRLVVHQGDQLARGINIAPRHRESIVHRRIQKRYRKSAFCIAKTRLQGDFLANLFDILRMRARHCTAEFGNELRVILRAHLGLLLGNGR